MTTAPPRPPMTFKEVRLLVDKSVNAWVDDYAPSMGAAIAYYTLFSIAPLLILVIAVAGLVYGEDAAQGQIVTQMQGQIGPEAAGVLQALIKSVSKPAQGAIATVVGVLTLLLGATSVFGELQSALNRIWRVPEPSTQSGLRHLIRVRLRSFGMVVGLGFLLVLSLTFSALLSGASQWSSDWFSGRETLLQAANFVVSFVVNTCLFAMIYKFMPRARVAWRDVGIGATVTALLFETSKLLIGLYLGRGTVGSGFGAAGSLVIFLVWVYFSAQIFLLGAEFTWVYSHQRGSRSERFQTKAVPLVPSRSGEATEEAKGEGTLQPAPSYPLTRRYVSAAAKQLTRGAAGAGRLVSRKPLLGLGLLVGVGLAAAALLRDRTHRFRDSRRTSAVP